MNRAYVPSLKEISQTIIMDRIIYIHYVRETSTCAEITPGMILIILFLKKIVNYALVYNEVNAETDDIFVI